MKKKSIKRSLVLSLLSLLLSITMLVSTTFAWFTDSVTSANNIISSGNLDVELYYQAEGQTDWTRVTEQTSIFMENALWECGHTEVIKLKAVNTGSLAFKYRFSINIAEETPSVNVYGDTFQLSDYIKYAVIDGDNTYDRETAVEEAERRGAVSLKYPTATAMKRLLPVEDSAESEHTVTLVVYMPEDVGNGACHMTGADVPTIKLGLNLLAVQNSYESDAFGDDYDSMLDENDSVYDIATLIRSIQDGRAVYIPEGTGEIKAVPYTETLMYAPAGNTIRVEGNGATIRIKGFGTAPGSNDYGYIGFIPAVGNDAVVSNLNFVGSGFVEIGHHGVKSGDIEANNLVIKDLVSTLWIPENGRPISAAFSQYGNAVMNDCVMTGTTTEKVGYEPYDAGFFNGSKTVINRGKYDKVYLSAQSHVKLYDVEVDRIDSGAIAFKNLGMLTVGAGTTVGTINLLPTGNYKMGLTIEEGAYVGEINFKDKTYTMEQWIAEFQ